MRRLTENELRQLHVPTGTARRMSQIDFAELLLFYTRARPGKSHRSRPYRLKEWLAALGHLSAWFIEEMHMEAPV